MSVVLTRKPGIGGFSSDRPQTAPLPRTPGSHAFLPARERARIGTTTVRSNCRTAAGER